jgi:hypothetical protein
VLQTQVEHPVVVRDDRYGITAREAAILAAAIIAVIGTAAITIGSDLEALLSTLVAALVNAVG